MGTVKIGGSIIAGNTGMGAPDIDGCFSSAGYNLIGTGGNECSSLSSTDLTGIDPKLAALADNGGPTQTEALLPGSPAIDAIPNNACVPEIDQRGAPRPYPAGGACDIGAYEYGAAPAAPDPAPAPPTDAPATTAAAAPTDTPIPTGTPTDTPTPTSVPTNTPTDTPTSVPANTPTTNPTATPAPPTATTRPVSPIYTAVPPTASAPHAGIPKAAPHRSQPSQPAHLALTVGLRLIHGALAGNSRVTVATRTRPRSTVKITLRLTHPVQTWAGKGRKRHKVTVTKPLYQTTAHAKADAKGRVNAVVRFGYNPRHSVQGTLTIVVHTVTGTTTKATRLTVVHYSPPKAHAAKGKVKAKR